MGIKQKLVVREQNATHILIAVDEPPTLRLQVSLGPNGDVAVEAYDWRGAEKAPVRVESVGGVEGRPHPEFLFIPAPIKEAVKA